MKIIIDDVFPARNFTLLIKILTILLSLNIFAMIISFCTDYLYAWVSNHIMLDMRSDLFQHLIQLPLNFFDKQKTGDIVHRTNNETNVVQRAVTASAFRFVHSSLVIIGLTVVLCWLNYQLFLVCIIALPFLFMNVRYFQPKIRKITEFARKKDSDILGHFVERFENIKLIQVYNRYGYENTILNSKITDLIGIRLKNVIISSLTTTMSSFLIFLALLVVIGWGGRQIIMGAMSVGALIAFIQYLSRLFDPFRDLMSLYVDLVRASVSMKRVFEFLDIPVQGNIHSKNNNFPVKGKIVFDNVDFAYNGHPVLKNLTLELTRGKKIALVGPSGCGKSTLVNLLCRFYEPDRGGIFIDDVSLGDIDLYELRRHIGVVTQDNQILHDTVWENIRYGNLESSFEEIEESMKFVDMHDHLTQLEDGFDTTVGDQGAKLSGGQKQRIAIARAILKNNEVLIMDEATSALDSESEKAVFDNLRKLYKDKTMILVSHRLSTIREVDEIICMDKGKVVENGTHEELTKKKGLYWQLFREQVDN